MINALAHVTFVEAPAGLLLFLAGTVAGALVTTLIHRRRVG